MVGTPAVAARHRCDQDDLAEYRQPECNREPGADLWRNILDANPEQLLRLRSRRRPGGRQCRSGTDTNPNAHPHANTFGKPNTNSDTNARGDAYRHACHNPNALCFSYSATGDTYSNASCYTYPHARGDCNASRYTYRHARGHSNASRYTYPYACDNSDAGRDIYPDPGVNRNARDNT